MAFAIKMLHTRNYAADLEIKEVFPKGDMTD